MGDFVPWVIWSFGSFFPWVIFRWVILSFFIEAGDFVFWVILSLGDFATLPFFLVWELGLWTLEFASLEFRL